MQAASLVRKSMVLKPAWMMKPPPEYCRRKTCQTGADLADRRLASRGTTHISVADADGNLASLTLSNGEGSSYVLPGSGIMLNNMLGEEDLNPAGFTACHPVSGWLR